MKNRSGFTLIEVVTSFLILSILAGMVFMTLSSVNSQLGRERTRTMSAFEEQGELEKEIEKVENLVKSLIEQEEIIASHTSTTAQIAAAQTEKERIEGELGAYDSSTTRINRQNITTYRVAVPRYNTDGEIVSMLTSWVVKSKGLVFPMPEVKNLKIYLSGLLATPANYMMDKTGKKMLSTVEYGKNADKLFKEQYTWYVTRKGFHMIEPAGETWKPVEADIGTRYPAPVTDYNYITQTGDSSPSETRSILSSIRDDMNGRFIALGLRPTIKEGKIGDETLSNLCYMASYPISSSEIIAAFDSSLIWNIPDNKKISGSFSGLKPNGSAGSSGNLGTMYTVNSRTIPEISPHGEKTGEVSIEVSDKTSKFDTYSRYFYFSPDSAYDMAVNGSAIPSNYTVFIACRSADLSGALLTGFIKYSLDDHSAYYTYELGFDKLKMYDYSGTSVYESSETNGGKIDAADDKWHIVSLMINQKQIEVYRDKERAFSVKFVGSFDGIDNLLRLGNSRGIKSNLSSSADMKVAEIVVTTSVDSQKLANMREYLCEKYGIS